MESYIEINVALDGRHFFATAPRSIDAYDTEKFEKVMSTFEIKFPKSEGYTIGATRYDTRGRILRSHSLDETTPSHAGE